MIMCFNSWDPHVQTIFTLCTLGTTENGLVMCQMAVTGKKVIHMMPALGPSLEDCPPKTEQVTL